MAVAIPSNVLYVGNLPKGTSKDNLMNFLQPYGVMRINVKEGYGIAEMNSVAEATKAIQQLNGSDFHGSSLAVRFKAPNQNNKQGGQFRQLNNNNYHSGYQNHSANGKKVFSDKDNFNSKSLTPTSPPVIQQEPMFGSNSNDGISPPSSRFVPTGSGDMRTVQLGMRSLHITTTNNLVQHQQKQQMHLEQELKNVAFLPDSEKVRQLEQLVHVQQSKINKLEARLEEIMDATNKPQHLQSNAPNNGAVNSRSGIVLSGNPSMPMQIQTQQQQPNPALGHYSQFPSFYGSQVQHQVSWPSAGAPTGTYPPPPPPPTATGPYYCEQQSGQSGFAVPPPLMVAAPSKVGTHGIPSGYGVCDSSNTGAYLATSGYAPQNIVRVGGDGLTPLPCDGMTNCFFPHSSVQMAHPVTDFHGHSAHHRDYKTSDGRLSGGDNRYGSRNNNGRLGAGDRSSLGNNNSHHMGHRHSKGDGQGHGNGRRQSNYASNKSNKPSLANQNEKNKAAKVIAISSEKTATPEDIPSPVSNENLEPSKTDVESVCPRCQKSIPETADKCPDCRPITPTTTADTAAPDADSSVVTEEKESTCDDKEKPCPGDDVAKKVPDTPPEESETS